MKERLRGFGAVYSFTFKQMAGTKSFKLTTFFVALLLAGGLIAITLFGASSGKSDSIKENSGNQKEVNEGTATEVSRVDNVLVIDESGLSPIDFAQFLKGDIAFEHIQFTNFDGTDLAEAVKSADVTVKTVILQITKSDTNYELKAALPERSFLTESDAQALLTKLSGIFQLVKLNKAGLNADQLKLAMQPVIYNYTDIGSDNSVATIIVKTVAPMIFSFMLYFMLIFYGQSVSKSVSSEKTSKLVETLLVSVRPDALIAGKVLAVAVQGVLQFVIWIGALFAGLYGGNAIAKVVYPGYSNPVITMIDTIRDSTLQSALSLPAVLLAIVFFFIGFLFYSVMSALAGCMVSKPEDAASTQSLMQFPMVISWAICYFAPLRGNDIYILRYIPFTAPFCVPVDTLTGVASLWESCLMLAVMLLFTILFVAISSRIFKGLILYSGQKVNLKTIQGILTGRQ